jgi:DNA-directed RNA polymerase subunit K/omega
MSDVGESDFVTELSGDEIDEDFLEIDEDEDDFGEETEEVAEAKVIIEKIKDKRAKQIPKSERTSIPILTKYERARLLGIRAQQIDMGCEVLVPVPKGVTDSLDIAHLELQQKKIPLMIRRYLPNGDYEDWELEELIN